MPEYEPTISTANTLNESHKVKLSAQKIDNPMGHHPFIYESNQVLLVFLCMSEDFVMKCPMCLRDTKYIIQHISKSKGCKLPGTLNSFKDQFGKYKENHKKEGQRKHKEKSRIKKGQKTLVK